MLELETALLPERKRYRQKRFVLHGLGGIGKTQLSVEFASQHHRKFSAVFWLDGRSKNSIKQSNKVLRAVQVGLQKDRFRSQAGRTRLAATPMSM